MALQKSYTDERGNTAATAYFVITGIQWTKRPGQDSNVTAQVYRDLGARNGGFGSMGQVTFPFNYDQAAASNIIAQAYAAMKALPEMAGALDV